MTITNYIGAAIITLPFILIHIGMRKHLGWREALQVWAISLGIVGSILVGSYLLVS